MIGFHMYRLCIQMHIYKISLLLFYSCNYIGHEQDYRYASSFVYPINMEILSASFHEMEAQTCGMYLHGKSVYSQLIMETLSIFF